MKKLIILLIFTASCTFAQIGAPPLEQIKIAADAGNPAAQVKLAERMDAKEAEALYRKAANQGYPPAEGKLGNLLLMRSQLFIGVKPEVRAATADEGIKWAMLAANQGDKQGQANLAQVYLEGKWVKQDLIEAYKWGELSAKNPEGGFIVFSGASFRNAAIVKMNAEQIAEAKRRVADFKPHAVTRSELPMPAWTKQIKLQGISGPADHRLASINGKTVEKGETATVKIDGKGVTIHCLDIGESSASISIEGIEGTQELKLSDN